MSLLAGRMDHIDASGIRKAFALAATLTDPVNLSIGQPDYDVDECVKEIAIRSIQEGKNSYTQTWGIDVLRDACSEYYERNFGVSLENVMITSGVSGGLFLALLALVDPGDEIIFGDPYFVMYKHLVGLLGGVPVPVNTYPDFKLKAPDVEAAITEKTKAIILNSPSNPTGVTLDGDDLAAIAEVAKAHDLVVISDEIYERLTYDATRATMAGLHEKVILLNGFSKTGGMTGWRVGYAAGPEEIIQAMNTLQQYTFVCAPSFAQHAAVEVLRMDHSAKVDAYRNKRDQIYEGLRDSFKVVKPTGAFYIFPEAPGGDGEAFAAKAIERNLIIIPGSVFSERNTHLRISFAADDETLTEGVKILNDLASEAL